MLVIVWAAALVLIAVVDRTPPRPWGRVLRAIREDEDAASASARTCSAYKLQALTVGAALAAVAGLFFAFRSSFFSPRRLRPAAHVLRVHDRDPRRDSTELGAPVSAISSA